MSQNIKCLAMLLDGPLQSWGYMSRFDRRTSLSYPTRSGLIGMLCAAMGIDRADVEGLEQFNSMKITVFIFAQGGRLTDYHTVGGGWDKKTHSQNIVPRTNGKPSDDAVITYREYLEDSKFGVILQDNLKQIEKIAEALKEPKWGIWFGRKSCIPASPVYQGIFDDMESALPHLKMRSGQSEILKYVCEVDTFEKGKDTLMVEAIDFKKRIFAPKRVLTNSWSE